jgi:hypothetical protein
VTSAGLQHPGWPRSSSPGSMTNSILLGSPQLYPTPAAAGSSTGPAAGSDRLDSLQTGARSWGASLAAAAGQPSRLPAAPSAPPAAAAGLSQLGDDVLGALSLSRYHRERSKLQEARAKQHALLASHHEGQAANLRNSRLGASPTPGVTATAAATAAVTQAGLGGAAGPAGFRPASLLLGTDQGLRPGGEGPSSRRFV